MRLTLLILALALAGCDGGASTPAGGSADTGSHSVESDTHPAFVLDASKPFIIEFGRGSGRHGLDIVRVDETGTVQLSRVEGRAKPESASLQLSGADIATLVSLVNSNQLTNMGRAYSDPRIADGTQWVLWLEQAPSQKAIYFNNSFPSQINAFASGLDSVLQKTGLNTATWTALSGPKADEIQNALWSRTKSAR